MASFTEKLLWGYSVLLQGLGFSFYTFATPVTESMMQLDPLVAPRYKALGWFIGGVGVLEAYAGFKAKNDVWLKRIVAGMVAFGDVAHLILPRLLSKNSMKTEDIVGVSLASAEVVALSYLVWKTFKSEKKD